MREAISGAAVLEVDRVDEVTPLRLCPPVARRPDLAILLDEPAARRGCRVLVVDDDSSIRLLCSVNLRDAGFEVIEAEDGRRALEQALSHPPDVVLTDVEMPRLDGFELARSLGDDVRTRVVPVVFMSGSAGVADHARAHELRAAGFVSKPFDPELLAPLLTHAIDRTPAPASRLRT